MILTVRRVPHARDDVILTVRGVPHAGDDVGLTVRRVPHAGDDVSLTVVCAEFNMLEMQANMGANSSLEELYPQVSIAILMRIIRDPSLSQHHTMVVQAITFIFKSLQMKCVPYVQQVIPAYLSVIRSADNNFKEVGIGRVGQGGC